MRKVLKLNLTILAMIIAVGFVMISCEEEGTGETGIWLPSSNDSVRVSNYTNTDLVAFKGSISAGNLLGGVRAQATNHALQYANNLGSNPAQFRMILITREQYEAGYSATTPMFTQMFVFWNGNVGDNTKIYEISDKLGGAYTLQIWNTSNFDVEFRVGGTAGPTLGFAQQGMTMTNLRVGAGDYMVYPVFQRINTLRDIVETVVPRYGNGAPVGWDVEFGTDPSVNTLALNLQTALVNVASKSLGAASVIVDNQGFTGVRFFNGSIPMVTAVGNATINNGATREFIVDMPSSATAGFASQRNISNFIIQMMGYQAQVKDEDGNATFTLLTDKMYTISVKGNGSAGDLEATINIKTPDVFEIEDADVRVQ